MATDPLTPTRVYKPFTFFLLTFLITWVSWFTSAFLSFNAENQVFYILAMLPGLVAPFAIALWLIYSSKHRFLRKGFKEKLFNLRLIKPSMLPAIFLLMPALVVISIAISTLFGQSWNQLRFSEGFSFSAGSIPVLLILFLAASFEELGWRSYAMDSINERLNYFKSTIIFGILWAFWHLPLFFIKDYYQYQLLQTNVLFAINFMVSILPLAFIISWVCRTNSGSITAAILFHFLINISQEALQMTQITKCIETFVLILVAAAIVIWKKEMFFSRKD
ncbi:MAG: type II CAAX endopeptidase family protein [Bacteroides sp.]|jgi:membrane protease YdiL (CAAX protease family)|nr:type II CAAX endopeptidase family protein [Bacteroides sp.]